MALANLSTLKYTQKNSFSLPNLLVVSSCKAGCDTLQPFLHCQPTFCIPEHVFPYHVVCVNTGSPVAPKGIVGDKLQRSDIVALGDINIYPANFCQRFHWHQDTEFIQLYLEPKLLDQVGSELYPNREIGLAPKITTSFDPLIYQIAIALKTSLEIDGTSSKLYTDKMTNALAIHLVSRYSTCKLPLPQPAGGLSKQQLKQVVEYIHTSLNHNISLTELANLVQLSVYHFTRLFKQSTGLAPHQYHIRCRIDRAKQLLLEKKLTLGEIAYTVGFASQGHLNYHFKRCVGVTPTTFLRQK